MAMAALQVGDNLNVRHTKGVPEYQYTFSVEVTEICSPTEFIGRVDYIRATNRDGAPAEVTGGDIWHLFHGQRKKFRNSDII
jgi:hypothetical protein